MASFFQRSAICNARGQTMLEYAMIMSVIAAILYAAYTHLGSSLTAQLGAIDALL